MMLPVNLRNKERDWQLEKVGDLFREPKVYSKRVQQ